jgi:hypothetical protein
LVVRPILHEQISTLLKPELAQFRREGRVRRLYGRDAIQRWAKHTNQRNTRILLCTRRERPRRSSAPNHFDEVASSHCHPKSKNRSNVALRHRRSNQEIMAGGIGALIRFAQQQFRAAMSLEGPKRELASSGLMYASAGCGHSDAPALGSLVPRADCHRLSRSADKHRYAPWRSLRRKSTNALSAGRIWRRLG